jgi:hypothetical protein
MAPKHFNKYAFVPSEEASEGIFIGWNSSFFMGRVLYTFKFAILFPAMHNVEEWILTTVYGPCQGLDRQEFIDYLNGIQIDDANWMIIGDLNFYRSLEDRNRETGGGGGYARHHNS